MTGGKSPLERVNIESSRDSPPSGRFRRPTADRSPTDELLGLLSNGRRRRLVAYLHSSDGSVSLSDAVTHVAESEENDGRSASVATDFHHVHLPKLADADVVQYDPEADVLEAGANADRAARLLESVTDGDSADSLDEHRSNPLAEACSTDDAFRLLADRTRRVLFSLLGETDEQVRLDDLAERVAAWKKDKPVTEVTADERETAKIGLHHKHLPMLADAGLLEYDRETRTLPERGRLVAVAEWLVACPSLETNGTVRGA